jgi:beta-galactosidase
LTPSRRAVLRTCMIGGAAATMSAAGAASVAGCQPGRPPASTSEDVARVYSWNQDWLFGAFTDGAEEPGFDDSGLTPVTLPHTVTPLSWGDWDPARWQRVWIYRKHFTSPARRGWRMVAGFDGVMVNATVVLNGARIGTHTGGYLPWTAELTRHLSHGYNVLAVIVDSRWLPVPPDGSPAGAVSVDYLQPGGIYRDVTLSVVPEIFVSDVSARPDDVLTPGRSVNVEAVIDASPARRGAAGVRAELRDGSRVLAAASQALDIAGPGLTRASLRITGIGDVTLWSPQTPKLYTVAVTVEPPGGPPHTAQVRTGFRETAFTTEGFFLNGARLTLFGLNRHQLFPYLGLAAPARLQRRDAEILRQDLNCNMVRCSHYPQSPHFLDACDELGLMVWEEAPGWCYVSEAEAWQDIVVQNVTDMVVRDRNRPSVVVWGTRLNETASHPPLYERTRQVAAELDGSRQTTGAMSVYSTDGWAQDVFAFDDYQSLDGRALLKPPMPGLPYLVSEAVGTLDGPPTYRWIDSAAALSAQAMLHAEVHDITRSDPRYGGLLGWAGFDYASLNGGPERIWHTLKTPGVVDIFRVPKPGAAFYQSQVDPAVRPVIRPVFFWDSGGPGPGAMIATNCDRLEIYVGGAHHATAYPDTETFGSLAYPPAFADLTVDGSGLPELRIDGYVGSSLAATARMSADSSADRLAMTADDESILADGTDATRVTFRAVDAYGNQRPRPGGQVSLSLAGPATLIGDNPFDFGTYGGVGGAFVRSEAGRAGLVTVTATHPTLGPATVRIRVADE